MRVPATFALGLSLGLVACAGSQTSADRHPSLISSQCLDPGQARNWMAEDDGHILVDAGRYKYRLTVAPLCTELDFSAQLVFRGDPVLGRICGDPSDAIIARGGSSCRIERVQLLDKQAYQQALDDRAAFKKARKD